MAANLENYQQLLSLNVSDSTSLNDLIHYNWTRQPISVNEYTESQYYGLGEKENLDKWKYENFTYKFNHYGFREENNLDNVDLGAFGCSFTFGQGMPIKMLWHNIIAAQNNLKSYNFGMPGGSIQSILEVFCVATKHVSIKKSIILLPSLDRMQIPKINNNGKLIFINAVPTVNTDIYSKDYNLDIEKLFKYIPEEHFIANYKNALHLADKLSYERNLDVFISSWSHTTYDILKFFKLTKIKLLPPWTSPSALRKPESLEEDLARDARHPGPKHHEHFVKTILPLIGIGN